MSEPTMNPTTPAPDAGPATVAEPEQPGTPAAPVAPAAEAEAPLTDHAYDGIREYDNPTPGWWTWIFVGTIGWSAIYFLFVTLAGGQLSPEGFFKRAQDDYNQKTYAKLGDLAPDAPTILKYARDEGWQDFAGAIFKKNCASCHGQEGQGVTGPNLTDDAYVYVKKVEDIADVVSKGRNNGAMPGWGASLPPNDIVLVASYVAALRGKNRPGLPPQGTPAPAWEAK